MRSDPVQTAIYAVKQYYPGALGAFVYGSVIYGDPTETSDIDIAVLFDDSFEDVHRNSVTMDDWPIEFFVHNPRAQDYFFDKDRRRGMCVMPTIVARGTVIPAPREELLLQQDKARAIIDAGPPALTEEDMALRRYTISDVIDDIRGARERATRIAMAALLYDPLGDFHLRANGRWSGFGKALLRCLHAEDEALAGRYEAAFDAAFRLDETEPLIALAEEVLEPFGGFLREGYRSAAPDDWRDFESGAAQPRK